jgi:hypothetical protein
MKGATHFCLRCVYVAKSFSFFWLPLFVLRRAFIADGASRLVLHFGFIWKTAPGNFLYGVSFSCPALARWACVSAVSVALVL